MTSWEGGMDAFGSRDGRKESLHEGNYTQHSTQHEEGERSMSDQHCDNTGCQHNALIKALNAKAMKRIHCNNDHVDEIKVMMKSTR